MGRPEKKLWVSPAPTIFLCLLLWQGRVSASSIFQGNSNSQGEIRHNEDVSSIWEDFDDAHTAPEERLVDWFSEKDGAMNPSARDFEWEDRSEVSNSLESDSYPMSSFPVKSTDEAYKNMVLPRDKTPLILVKTKPTAPMRLPDILPSDAAPTSHKGRRTTISATVDRLAIKQSRFGRENAETASISPPNNNFSVPSHDIHYNNSNNESSHDVGSNGAKGFPEKPQPLMASNYIKNWNNKETTPTTMNAFSVNTSPPSLRETAENSSGGGGGSSSLQFKFPYRIPFPYVRRESNEDENRKSGIKTWNTNEGGQPTDQSQTFFDGALVRLQRRNRSKRDTLKEYIVAEENKGGGAVTTGDDTKPKEEVQNVVNFEESEDYKSGQTTNNSTIGNTTRESELTGTNVRDNANSRPPSSSPVEVLQRLTRLLDRMLRELSTFGQKFTLRLIRMTERQDIDQMQEIMKDFEISATKPIFFIAGGLRLLNESSPTRGVSSPVTVTSNLNTNATNVFLNESLNGIPTSEVPVANFTEEQTTTTGVEGTTMVPILRPGGISSLPVDSEIDDANLPETTTGSPESDLVIPGHNISDLIALPTNSSNNNNVTTSVSPPKEVLLARRKRSVPIFDEFHFFPMPGRSARTENPYDEEDEEFEPLNYEQAGESTDGSRNDERSQHLPSVVSSASGSPNGLTTTVDSVPAEIIDQSHDKGNDESNALIGYASSNITQKASPVLDATLLAATPPKNPEVPTTFPVLLLNGSNSITRNEQGGNDQNLEGEQIIRKTQVTNAAVSAVDSVNTSHEEHLSKKTQQSSKEDILYDSSPISGDRILPHVPDLGQTGGKLDSSPLNEDNVVPNKNLNLAIVQAEVTNEKALGARNEGASSPPIMPTAQIDLSNAGSSSELLFHGKENENIKVVAPTKPVKVSTFEERALRSPGSVGAKQNIAEEDPHHEVILMKSAPVPVEFASQQLLSSSEVDRVSASALNKVVEVEKDVYVPLLQSRVPPVVETILVTDAASPVSTLSTVNEPVYLFEAVDTEKTNVNPLPLSPTDFQGASTILLEDINANDDVVGAPLREVIFSEPLESNQNEPKVENKNVIDMLFSESDDNIPKDAIENIETLSIIDPGKMSTSVKSTDQVAAVHQRNIPSIPTNTINNIHVVEDAAAVPNSVVGNSLIQSNIAPVVVYNTPGPVGSPRPITVNPTEIHFHDVDSENEERPRKKQQSFNLGEENQGEVVSGQSVDVEDMKKVVVGQVGEEIGREKEQVALNQPVFHAPTVSQQSLVIDNNNKTFLQPDKVFSEAANVMSIHSAAHGVVHETEPAEHPGPKITLGETETTNNINIAVKNAEASFPPNSEYIEGKQTIMPENENGSIISLTDSRNGEARNPSETRVVVAGNKNADLLAPSVVADKPTLTKRIISQEPSKIVSLNKINAPLTGSLGTDTTVLENSLNGSSSSENSSIGTPISVSVRSKDVDLPVKKISGLKIGNEIPQHVQTFGEATVATEEKANTDETTNLTKVIRDTTPETVTAGVKAVPDIATVVHVPTNQGVEGGSVVTPKQVQEVNKKVKNEVEPVSTNPSLQVNSYGGRGTSDVLPIAAISNADTSKIEHVNVAEGDVVGGLTTATHSEPTQPKVVSIRENVDNIPVTATNADDLKFTSVPPPQSSDVKIVDAPVVVTPMTTNIETPQEITLLNTNAQTTPETLSTIKDKIGGNVVVLPEASTDNTKEELKPVLAKPYTQTVELTGPVLGLFQGPVEETSSAQIALKPNKEVIPSKEAVAVVPKPTTYEIVPDKLPVVQVQPVGSKVPSNTGDDQIIASLPQTDPDAAFGVKPIDTEPHFQIPGLRPNIPQRPRPQPDYVGYISENVDADTSLLFSTPVTPIIVSSPPVFSRYSPAAILQKQELMMKNYFNGVLFRRA